MSGKFSPDAARRAAEQAGRAAVRALRFGPSMVSLSALIWAAPALAQTTISTATTAPLVTSTAGNVTINPAGSIRPTSGVAVTIDSNNSLNNTGVIQFLNVDNVTGVLIRGGRTGNVANNGSIQTDDSFVAPTDKNGIPHGVFDNGTGRYGIRLIGPGGLTGDIINGSLGGGISVKGNNSYGVSLESNLIGNLTQSGALSVLGDNSYAIRTTGAITGGVTLGGVLTATGQNVQGANFGGDIGGQLLINGAVNVTGFRFTTRSTNATFLAALQPDDMLLSGAALTIGGSVARGVLVSTSAADANGVVTGTTGAIASISSAPALVVGAVGRNITLGNVDAATAPYGLDIRGTVVGDGVYDGIGANAVQLGVAGGGTVDTSGGVHVSGTVAVSSYGANTTALHLNSGVSAPLIRNDGTIAATLTTDAAGVTAQAVSIEAGANLRAFTNTKSISATVAGPKGNVTAIIDRSGTLSEVANTGAISAGRNLTDLTTAVTGKATALDLSANTGGAHLIQTMTAGATAPSINGAVSFGSGADRVEVLAGSLTGDLNLGAGANSLSIDNAATVRGALNASGGTVALSVGSGSLQINNASQLKLTSLSLGAASSLILTADPSAGLATRLDVAGNANIATGAKIGVRFNSIQQGSRTYVLIRADRLNAGTIDASLLGAVPFLYTSALSTDLAAGTVSATLALKSAAQLGLPTNTAGAYQAIINNIGRDQSLQGALLVQNSRGGLINLYNQLLPNHSGAIFNLMSASVSAFGRPIDQRQDPAGGGFWMQEANLGLFANGKVDEPGYKGWSLGAIGGYEIPRTPLGILGVTFGASTNQVYADNTDTAENLHATLFEAGAYWRMSQGAFSANVRVAGDYARVTSDRVIQVLGGEGLAVTRTANGNWNSLGFNVRAAASYEGKFAGHYYFRPQASVDYVRFTEGSYREAGGGDGVNLAISSRTSSRASAFAGVAVGALYGPDRSWGPEALVGYKAVASEVLGATTARFVAASDSFTLRSDSISGQGAVAHLSLKGENGSGGFAIGAGAEARDGLNIYDLRLTGHVQF